MAGFGLVPFFRRWFDDVPRTHSLFDQAFGQSLFDNDLWGPMDYFPTSRRMRGSDGPDAPVV